MQVVNILKGRRTLLGADSVCRCGKENLREKETKVIILSRKC